MNGLEHASGLKKSIRNGSFKRDDTTEAVCGTALLLVGLEMKTGCRRELNVRQKLARERLCYFCPVGDQPLGCA